MQLRKAIEPLFFGLMDALMLYPLAVVITSMFNVSLIINSIALALLCSLARYLGRLRGSKRLAPGIATCAMYCAGWIAFGGGSAGSIVSAALGCLAFLYCLWISVKPWEDVYRPTHIIAPLTLYLGAYMLLFVSQLEAHAYLWMGAAPYLFCLIMLQNTRIVKQRAAMRNGVSKRVMRQNMWMTGVTLVAILLLINVGYLRNLLVTAIQRLLLWIIELMSRGEGESSGSGDAFGGDMDMSGLGEDAGPSQFWVILGIIASWIALIAAAIGIIYGIYRFFKWLLPLLARTFKGFQLAYQDGYEEVSESLLSARQIRDEFVNSFKLRVKKLFTPPPNWDKLTDEQRVRMAYLRTMQRSAEIGIDPTAMTPSELLSNDRVRVTGDKDGFLKAYNDTRYGDITPSKQQTDNARDVYTGKEK